MNPDDLPPVEFLVKARQHLPPPGPGLPRSQVDVNAGPRLGRFELTFVIRQYSSGRYVWEIDSSKCVDPPRF